MIAKHLPPIARAKSKVKVRSMILLFCVTIDFLGAKSVSVDAGRVRRGVGDQIHLAGLRAEAQECLSESLQRNRLEEEVDRNLQPANATGRRISRSTRLWL